MRDAVPMCPHFCRQGMLSVGPHGTAVAGAGLQAQQNARSKAPARASAMACCFAKSPWDCPGSARVTERPESEVLTT